MSRWAGYVAAALLALAIILWWLSRDAEASPEEPMPADLPEDLTRLPNYRKPGDLVITFATHDDFVRALSDAFLSRFPSRAARGLLIAHAATAGWHLPGRPPLYWWSLWGQLITMERIRAGDLFTILTAPGGKKVPYRAYPTPEAALEGYLWNVRAYGTGGVSYLDNRGTDLTLVECRRYAEIIRPWFAVAQRTDAALDEKATDFHWIWRNKIRPVIA